MPWNYDSDDEEGEIEQTLRDLGGHTEAYPSDLYAARRDEFVANVRKSKRPGCPLFGLMSLGMLALVGWTIYLIVISL